MAYEAPSRPSRAAEAPGALITVSQCPPFGLRKLSATLARALGPARGATPLDVAATRVRPSTPSPWPPR